MNMRYKQFFCPLCGKTNHRSTFDPSDYEEAVFGVNFRGLGRGKGFAISEEGSLAPEDPIMGLLTDRVAVLHDGVLMGDAVEEHIDDVNALLGTQHETLLEASLDTLSRLEDYIEEDEDDEEESTVPIDYVDDDFESVAVEPAEHLSALDAELLQWERDEEEEE